MLRFTALAATLALTACGGPSVSLTNVTPEEVAKAVDKAGAAPKMKAGQWEMKSEVLEVNVPGMPADKIAAMKAAGSSTESKCVTQKDVDRTMTEVLPARGENPCKYVSYSGSRTRVAYEMRCPGPVGEIAIKSDASYSDVKITENNESEMPMPTGKAHSKMRITATRTGDCAAPAAPAKK